MARPLGPGTKAPLWGPDLGIRFSRVSSPCLRPSPGPSYPRLDMSRFFRTAGHGTGEGCSTAKEVLDAGGSQPDTSGPDGESIEMCIESARLRRFSSLTNQQSANKPAVSSQTLTQSSKSVTLTLEETQSTSATEVEPPSTSLSFNISRDLFYAARSAKAGSSDSFWSHTMYERKSAAGATEKVKVHYCTSNETMESVCKHFLQEEVLGLDLEWFPFATREDGARENVSVIQMASPDRIALFHVAIFPQADELASPTFRKIMQDASVSKVGVQIRGDCNRLRRHLGVDISGIFELSHLYKQVKFSEAKTPKLINKSPVALATQVEELLRLPLFKGAAVRSSNWMKSLDREQILYSASDAFAGIQLYHVLEAKRKALDPCPERPHHLELGLPIPYAQPKKEPDVEADDAGEPSDASGNNDDKMDSDTPNAAPPRMQKTPPTRPRQKAPRQEAKFQDARIVTAEEKAARYRASKRVVSARPASLRAYFLWYANEDLGPVAIAKLLRDPPLQANTVLSYIMEAIAVEKLPFGKARLKLELLPLLHEKLREGRYSALVRSCEEEDLG